MNLLMKIIMGNFILLLLIISSIYSYGQNIEMKIDGYRLMNGVAENIGIDLIIQNNSKDTIKIPIPSKAFISGMFGFDKPSCFIGFKELPYKIDVSNKGQKIIFNTTIKNDNCEIKKSITSAQILTILPNSSKKATFNINSYLPEKKGNYEFDLRISYRPSYVEDCIDDKLLRRLRKKLRSIF